MIRPLPALACALALALAGCATDRITLLDGEAGNAGAVAVIGPGGTETVIDTPFTQASLGSGTPRTRSVDPERLGYDALLTALPPAAARFRITFPSDESVIPPTQRGILDQIRAELAMAGRSGAQIEVAGFTDSVGSDAYNVELSRKRAEAVAAQLRADGFEIDPADAVGRGEYDARAQLGDEVRSETYRRVDVIIR